MNTPKLPWRSEVHADKIAEDLYDDYVAIMSDDDITICQLADGPMAERVAAADTICRAVNNEGPTNNKLADAMKTMFLITPKEKEEQALLDEFAGRALPAVMDRFIAGNPIDHRTSFANESYAIARAMMLRREILKNQ